MPHLLTTGDLKTEWLIWVLGPFAIIVIALREWRQRHPRETPA
jgi:hypothetical protein